MAAEQELGWALPDYKRLHHYGEEKKEVRAKCAALAPGMSRIAK